MSDLLELELGRARRRDPLDRDLPLDLRPRPAVPAHARGAAPGRAARGAVRGRGQHRRRSAAARATCSANAPYAEHFVGWRTPWNYAAAGMTQRAPAGRRLRLAPRLAHAGATRARAAARVPHHGRARPTCPAAAARAARALHGRGHGGARRAGRDRLCAPEHRRRRLSSSARRRAAEASSAASFAAPAPAPTSAPLSSAA